MHNHFILHLSLIEKIGPAIIDKIVHSIKSRQNYKEAYYYTAADWMQVTGIGLATASTIVEGLSNKQMLDKELALIDKHSVGWTSWLDEHYPALLKHIHLPPAIIYWQGDTNALTENSLAIVGARKANSYAERFINHLVPLLVAHEWTVVSGGALGADSMAHNATLNAGGKTIAVLGSGLLQPYPLSNKKLFKSIIEQSGMVISTFPLTMEPLPGNFPARNRIISGLSRGCVVIQAASQSGASITANYALDQGREVFALPGSIDDPLSDGCHDLIKKGAKLITTGLDILEEFEITVVPYSAKDIPIFEQASFVLKSMPDQLTRIKESFFTDQEKEVLGLCLSAQSIDELAERSTYDIRVIQTLLFDLQLKDAIVQEVSGLWKTVL